MAREELKQRQAAVWGSGPFERIEAAIADMHRAFVESLSPRRGERLLDFGCETPYRPETGEEAWIVLSTACGPTNTLADSLEPERREELERSWIDCLEGLRDEDGILQSPRTRGCWADAAS